MLKGRKMAAGVFTTVAITFTAGAYVAATGNAEPSHDDSAHDHSSHDHSHDHSGHEHEQPADGRNDPFGILGEETGVALPERDPCSVVTAEEAALVLGELAAVGERGVGVVSGQRVCTYSLASNPHLGAALAITDRDAEDKLELLEHAHSAGAGPVTGLDGAIWIDQFKLLVVVKGDWLLSVQLLVPAEERPAARAKAVTLATAALDRL